MKQFIKKIVILVIDVAIKEPETKNNNHGKK